MIFFGSLCIISNFYSVLQRDKGWKPEHMSSYENWCLDSDNIKFDTLANVLNLWWFGYLCPRLQGF